MKTLAFALLLSIGFLQISCGEKGNNPGFITAPLPSEVPKNTNGDPIVGDNFTDEEMVFPEESPLFVALIELKSPALLQNASRNKDGSYSIDASIKKKVIAEQKELEVQLADISSEIKVLYRYRMVLNAFAIEAPQALAQEINQIEANFIEADELFSEPQAIEVLNSSAPSSSELEKNNSMTFVGVQKIHETLKALDKDGNLIPVKGKGMKVGIIDSGIDYTHTMFGGGGDISIFKSIDANKAYEQFPTAKVVGGTDFVGANYSPSSHIYMNRIPQPDGNPIDQSGHGTHVAGTAGGIGDGINTYNGAAPEADLYALKVFGDKGGGTSDTVVIAAMEYAADPNGDLSTSDKLDVVNISIGGGFGKPHNLYNRAVENLVNGGTVVVASAGNSGPTSNIVGAPSTADAAISVAASIDNMDHNIQFAAIEFKTPKHPSLLAEAIQGSITKPINKAGPVQGKLVYIGLADKDLTTEQQEALPGNVALIDRGENTFADKINRATTYGAIGIIMVNNREGPAGVMGGPEDVKLEVPGVMVPQEIGSLLREEMTMGDTLVHFQTEKKVEKPEFIDTLARFSSQGPRVLDSAIKPEIAAPGAAIISAQMGKGSKGVKKSGTSMSAPLVTGIVALLMQHRKHLNPQQIKSIVMNSGTLIGDKDGNTYPISRQGAGRIQAYQAALTDIAFSKPALSLGELQVGVKKTLQKHIVIENLSDKDVSYSLSINDSEKSIEVSLSETNINLSPGDSFGVEITITLNSAEAISAELDAFIQVHQGDKIIGSLPILAVVNRVTDIQVENILVESISLANSAGASAQVHLNNSGSNEGVGLLFNLLGTDGRKVISDNPGVSMACDLESVGYRVILRDDKPILQIAGKLFNPVTTWGSCDLSVSIDLDGDQKEDKELIGTSVNAYPGFQSVRVPGKEDERPGLASLLLDSKTAEKISLKYRKEVAKQPKKTPLANYLPALDAVSQMISFDHSTLAVVETAMEPLGVVGQSINLRVSANYNGRYNAERSDSLDGENSGWKKVSLSPTGSGYHDMPEAVVIPAGEKQMVTLKKGDKTNEALIAYFPRNKFTLHPLGTDEQAQVFPPNFRAVLKWP